jgi:ribosome modulation factor
MRLRPSMTEMAMSEELPLPKCVIEEGVASYLHGLPREDCPYPPGSDEREQWLEGWGQTARRDRPDENV